MKKHLFTCLLLLGGLLGNLQAQQPGQIVSVTPLFNLSASQTQDMVNNLIPIGLPSWIVNILTDIDYGTKGYKVVYYTTDFDGNLTIASGAMVVPSNYGCSSDMMVYCHGTVFDPADVPSNMSGAGDGVEFIFGLIYAGNGYVTVMPDYLGLGDGPDFHLYVEETTQASATRNMVKAVQTYSNQNGIGLTGDLHISGYSQGGHAGMSFFKNVKQQGLPGFSVATVGLGSGPYDLSNTQYNYIVGNPNYPTREYILYTIASCQEAYGNLYSQPSDILIQPYAELYVTNILGQTGQTDWVPIPWTQMFVPAAYQNYISNPNNPLKQCLQQSDVYDWYNTTPTEMYYCTGDEQVAYQSSLIAEDAMEDNLPWYYFWFYPYLNATYVGGFSHFDCVIPYGILSKWHFDSYQSWCWWLDEDEMQERELEDDKRIHIPRHNYLYTDIDVRQFGGRLVKVEFLYMDGTLAKTVRDLEVNADGWIEIPSQDLRSGSYFLRLTDEQGNTFLNITVLREAKPMTHREYDPLVYNEDRGEWLLDLGLLEEEVLNIKIYNEAKRPVQQLDFAGRLNEVAFQLNDLRAGNYLLEVQTTQNSYFLPLEIEANAFVDAGFGVYPNPSDGQFTIQLPEDADVQAMTIYDAQGRAVWTPNQLNTRTLQPNLEPGTYQLQVVLADGSMLTERIFVVKR